MKLSIMCKLLINGQLSLVFKLLGTSNEFYRACFVSTALSEGIYDHFVDGKASFGYLCEKLGADYNREGLRAWLELGVSLRELKHAGSDYCITGRLSKALLKPDNDACRAFLEEIVKYHHAFIVNTPGTLRKQKWFPFDESPGELIARSSRISEPFIGEAVDSVIPRQGEFHLLEVGCGSGIYIQRACARNPDLHAVGLELQEKVAGFARTNIKNWGLERRVIIEHCDARDYSTGRKFDLVTLHQNIYYFPVAERVALARRLAGYLKPGGKLLLTTVCQGGGPSAQVLDIWVSTTEGYGALPDTDELCKQLKEAGFAEVSKTRLMPFESFWAFVASKSA